MSFLWNNILHSINKIEMGVGDELASVGRGVSLVVSVFISILAIILFAGGAFTFIFKAKDVSKDEQKGKEIAGGIMMILAVVILIVVWVVFWLFHKSELISQVEGGGAVLELL